jgi:hypothetical protein
MKRQPSPPPPPPFVYIFVHSRRFITRLTIVHHSSCVKEARHCCSNHLFCASIYYLSTVSFCIGDHLPPFSPTPFSLATPTLLNKETLRIQDTNLYGSVPSEICTMIEYQILTNPSLEFVADCIVGSDNTTTINDNGNMNGTSGGGGAAAVDGKEQGIECSCCTSCW